MLRNLLILLTVCTLLVGCDLFVSPERRVDRAAELIEKGDYRAASIELRNALQKEPENGRGRLLMARTALWLGDAEAAEKELKRAVAAGVSVEDSNRLDAEVKRALRQHEALQSAMAASVPGLEEWERLMFLGYAQLGQGKLPEAQASFDAAVQAAPAGRPGAEARRAQAEGMAAAGNGDGALAVLDQALVQDPAYGPAALTKAALLGQRGDFAAAESALTALQPTAKGSTLSVPEQVAALAGLVEAQLAERKLVEARQSVGQLAALAPNAPLTAYLKGRLALAEGKGEEAVTELQKALAGAPGFVPALLLLGIAQLGQGNVAQAEAQLQKVIEISPDNVEARKLLAQAQIRQGRGEAASSVLSPALASDTADPELFKLAGQAKVLEGAREEGEALLERGLAAAQDDPQARLEIAGSYLTAGDAKRALELLATVPDEVGGDTKKQMQFLALAAGKDKAVAKLEIGALLKRYPQDVRLLNLAAGWLGSQGDTEAARGYLQQALAVAPNDARTLLNLGRVEYRAKRLPEARKAFEGAVAADAKLGDAYLALAALSEAAGNPNEALGWLEKWSAADSAAGQPRVLLARHAFLTKDLAKGRKLLDEALKAAPNSAQVEAAAGQVLMDAAIYDEALAHFRKAASLNANEPRYHVAAAQAQLALNQREAARESLNRALSVRSNFPPALVLLVQIELGDKRVDAALGLANRLKADPNTDHAGFALEGDILMAAGRPAEAVTAYARSGQLEPTSAVALGEYRARKQAGPAPANEPLLRWLERNPSDTRVRVVLAQDYEAQGNATAAIREYELVVKTAPDAAGALNNLAWLYAQQGDARAEPTARRAHELAPQAPAVADTLGWVLLRNGKFEEALKLFQQAHDSDKENAEIRYHLGMALLKTGQPGEGRKELQAAIEAGGSAAWVAEARQALEAAR